MSQTVELNIPHSARLRYVAQLEAHMDEGGKTGPNNVRDLIEMVRQAETIITSLVTLGDEARTKAQQDRDAFFKWMKERPTAPHPIDQMSNLNREMLLDAEAECKELRAQLATARTDALKEAKGIAPKLAVEILSNCALRYITGPQRDIDRSIELATRLTVHAIAALASAPEEPKCECCEGSGKAFNAIDMEWSVCLYCGGTGKPRHTLAPASSDPRDAEIGRLREALAYIAALASPQQEEKE